MFDSLNGAICVSILGGTVTNQRALGLPFQLGLIDDLAELDIENVDVATVLLTFPTSPIEPARQGPLNAFGLDDLVIGFGIYVGGKLVDVLIGELVGRVYEDRVRPALAVIRSKLRSTPHNPPRSSVAVFDHWFDGTGVLVRIRVHEPAESADEIAVIVAACLHLALAQLARPITHRVMTFDVQEGKIPTRPSFSEPI